MSFAAIIERHDKSERRIVIPPHGTGITRDMDAGGATRNWLHPYIGEDWRLVEFLDVQESSEGPPQDAEHGTKQ